MNLLKKLNLNSNGFGHIEAVLAIVVIGAIGAIGVRVMTGSHAATPPTPLSILFNSGTLSTNNYIYTSDNSGHITNTHKLGQSAVWGLGGNFYYIKGTSASVASSTIISPNTNNVVAKPAIKAGLVTIEHISWSPAASKLAVVESSGPNTGLPYALYVMDSAGKQQQAIIPTSQKLIQIINVTWSPDGKTLYFTGQKTGSSLNIYSINVDGSGLALIVPGGTLGGVSPDGSNIAYTSESWPNPCTVYLADTTGRNAKVLSIMSNNTITCANATFSPNGNYVAYDSYSGNPILNTINLVQLSTKNQSTYSAGTGGSGYYVWSPDSSEIAYANGTGPINNQYIVNLSILNVSSLSTKTLYSPLLSTPGLINNSLSWGNSYGN